MTDELFGDNDVDNFCSDNHVDNVDTGMNSESSVSTEVGNQKQSSNGARMSSDTPKSAGKKKQRSFKMRPTGQGLAELDRFNALLMMIAKRKSVELVENNNNKPTGDNVSNLVSFMSNWKSARESIGCPIKAAYFCPEFEQFLDRKESKQLCRYHQEMEDPLSSDSSE
jgi:hypothetical protein